MIKDDVPDEAPHVDKTGLDLLMWMADERIFVEAISAAAQDHFVEYGAEADDPTWIFGVGVDLGDFLSTIPEAFTYGLMLDDGEVSRITPSRLH